MLYNHNKPNAHIINHCDLCNPAALVALHQAACATDWKVSSWTTPAGLVLKRSGARSVGRWSSVEVD